MYVHSKLLKGMRHQVCKVRNKTQLINAIRLALSEAPDIWHPGTAILMITDSGEKLMVLNGWDPGNPDRGYEYEYRKTHWRTHNAQVRAALRRVRKIPAKELF